MEIVKSLTLSAYVLTPEGGYLYQLFEYLDYSLISNPSLRAFALPTKLCINISCKVVMYTHDYNIIMMLLVLELVSIWRTHFCINYEDIEATSYFNSS